MLEVYITEFDILNSIKEQVSGLALVGQRYDLLKLHGSGNRGICALETMVFVPCRYTRNDVNWAYCRPHSCYTI